MARPLRMEIAGGHYHITARGNRGDWIFADDEDREKFLETLKRLAARFDWSCLAYCLMSNHYHLIIQIREPNLSKGMRELNGIYAQYFNRRHGTCGHMFQGRFKSIIVEDDSHLTEAIRYVVLNPVRAKMVEHPGDYPFSSYTACAGLAGRKDVVNMSAVAGLFARRLKAGMAAFSNYVASKPEVESPFNIIRNGWILGSDKFTRSVMNELKDRDLSKEHPMMSRAVEQKSLREIFPSEWQNKQERNQLIVSANIEYRHTMAEIADYLGLHYATVSRIIKKNS